MNETPIRFASMLLALSGESAEHLLPQRSTLICRHVAPPDRGDDDPGLQDVQHAPVWRDLAISHSPWGGGQIFAGCYGKPDGSPFFRVLKTKV